MKTDSAAARADVALTDRMRVRHRELQARRPTPAERAEALRARTAWRNWMAEIAASTGSEKPQTKAPRPATRRRGAGKPAGRTATRSSARSGDSGDDPAPGEPPPAVAPPTAREAVARVWEDVLRRKHPSLSWEVVP